MFEKIHTSKQEVFDTVKNYFEALKPWLDREMFFSIKDKEDSTKTNANFGKKNNKVNTTLPSKIEDDGDGIIIE